jgi:hypothetical protein
MLFDVGVSLSEDILTAALVGVHVVLLLLVQYIFPFAVTVNLLRPRIAPARATSIDNSGVLPIVVYNSLIYGFLSRLVLRVPER